MHTNTRRRALGLILAAGLGLRLPIVPRARAAEKDCFDSKPFGPWKGLATDTQAGARINQVQFDNDEGCDLHADVQVATSYDAKIVLYGDRDQIKLPKKFLIDPANRLIVKTADGKEAVNEALCGNCTDIFDNKVSVVLPLATAPLFRESATIEIVVKLGDKEECHLKLDCESLRKALDWAAQRQTELAQISADQKMHLARRRLLHHHRLLRDARPRRRLLRACRLAPLSRPGARQASRRQGRHRALL